MKQYYALSWPEHPWGGLVTLQSTGVASGGVQDLYLFTFYTLRC